MNWDYIAGFLDGEGSVGAYQKKPHGKHRYINFSNTHLATLETIRNFMEVGRIGVQAQNSEYPLRKVCYLLYIRRIDDLRTIVPELLSRCIIKRDALVALAKDLATAQPAKNTGRIAAIGATELQRLYWDEQLSPGKIAELIGVSPGAVREYMLRHGVQLRTSAAAYALSERGALASLGAKEVRRLYWDEGLSSYRIGKRVGVTHSAVAAFMGRHGIPRRTRGEANLLSSSRKQSH